MKTAALLLSALFVIAGCNGEHEEHFVEVHIENPSDEIDPTTPGNDTPIEDSPNEDTPINDTPVDETPVDGTPIDDTPIDDTPIDDTPIDDTPIDDTPIDDTPIDDSAIDDSPIDDSPIDDTPIDDTPIDDTPSDDDPETPPPSLRISWDANLDIIDGYSIYVADNSEMIASNKINTLFVGDESWLEAQPSALIMLSELPEAVTNHACFSVSAFNLFGESELADAVCLELEQ